MLPMDVKIRDHGLVYGPTLGKISCTVDRNIPAILQTISSTSSVPARHKNHG